MYEYIFFQIFLIKFVIALIPVKETTNFFAINVNFYVEIYDKGKTLDKDIIFSRSCPKFHTPKKS